MDIGKNHHPHSAPIVLCCSWGSHFIRNPRQAESLPELDSLRARIAELEQANATLQAREGLYRGLIERLPDMIWVVGANGAVTFLNEACETITGYTGQELLSREPPGVFALESPPAARGEIRIASRSGAVVDLEVETAPLGRAGAAAGVLAIARDITGRPRAQGAIRQGAWNFESLFSNLPLPVWLFDATTLQFLEVNRAAVERYGYSREEFLAMSVADLRPSSEAPRFLTYLNQLPTEGCGCAGVWRYVAKGGEILDAEVFWRSLEFAGTRAILSVVQDVTGRRLIEEQSRQSNKLEAVGRLAGGIAHDFNNLLTVITGYSQLLLNRMDGDHPMRASLDEIRSSADRASVLTRQLVAFSRRLSLKPALLDLNRVVSGMEKVLRGLLGADIELVERLGPGLVQVQADPSLIEQVILNLALNARQAMPVAGTLTLETAAVEFQTAESAAGHRPGHYAMIAVHDTGQGIDTETRNHLFEPFSSSRAEVGSGLGLSAVYGIVEQHGGFILVSSEPGQGSRFRIYLPQTPDRAEISAHEAAPGGSETILVVEEESGVLKLIAETLRGYGYTTIEVRNSEEALAMAREGRAHVDLLLTGIVMPMVDRSDLVAAWRMLRPDLKVLFLSGYNFKTAADQKLPGLDGSLPQKLFSGPRLARKVREALDGSAK